MPLPRVRKDAGVGALGARVKPGLTPTPPTTEDRTTMHRSTNNVNLRSFEQDYLAWYNRCFKNPGRPFDPASLVQAVREQFPSRPEWAEAFARCTREWPRNELYTHFLSYPEFLKRWNYAGGFFLQHPTLGALAVDTIHDADAPVGISIGGIEYLDRVMGHPVDLDAWRRAMEAMAPHAGALRRVA